MLLVVSTRMPLSIHRTLESAAVENSSLPTTASTSGDLVPMPTAHPTAHPTKTSPAALAWKVGGAPLTPAQLVDCMITGSDLEEAVKHVQPSVRREGFTTAPDVAWDDVGSLEQVWWVPVQEGVHERVMNEFSG